MFPAERTQIGENLRQNEESSRFSPELLGLAGNQKIKESKKPESPQAGSRPREEEQRAPPRKDELGPESRDTPLPPSANLCDRSGKDPVAPETWASGHGLSDKGEFEHGDEALALLKLFLERDATDGNGWLVNGMAE